MGLFNFGKKKPPTTESQSVESTAALENSDQPVNSDPQPAKTLPPRLQHSAQGIDLIYDYLNQDFENMGYNDALCSPDIAYKEKAKIIISFRLKVLIDQIKIKYQDDLREIEFHIDSRSKAGLIDMIFKLNTNKEKLTQHYDKLLEIEKSLQDQNSYLNGMTLAYEKGFMRGLATLSMDKINTL
ncbi:MAG: hypothetical protein ACK5JU_07515 [Bacteroidales bacterium]